MQPRKFETMVKSLQMINAKSYTYIGYLKIEIAKNCDFTYLLHSYEVESRLFWQYFALTASSNRMRTIFNSKIQMWILASIVETGVF